MKCGSGSKCLALTAVDCGGGKSCSAGTLCVRGGAECLTRQEIADRARAEKQRRDEEAARVKREADDRREAARKKEEERKQEIASKKEEAQRVRAEKQRQIDEARQAAKRKQEEEVAQKKAEAEAKRLAAEQRKIELRAGIGSIRRTDIRQIVAAWTPARMRGTRPLPLPEVDPEKLKKIPVPPRTTPPSREGGVPEYLRGALGSGLVYTVPLKWAGKLFFTKSEGDNVCSGQFIAPRIVLTAAHCVRDYLSGQFFGNIVFALQYQNGNFSRKYGTECVAAPEGWVDADERRYRWDYALILTDQSSATGHFGWQADWQGSYDAAHKIGYPQDIASGELIQVDNGPITIAGPIVELRHGNPLNKEGSSGGAWVGRYSNASDNNGNYVLSVTSFGHRNTPGVAWGPYLDHDFNRLLEYVKNGCR